MSHETNVLCEEPRPWLRTAHRASAHHQRNAALLPHTRATVTLTDPESTEAEHMKNVESGRGFAPAVALQGRASSDIIGEEQGVVTENELELAKLAEPQLAEEETEADLSVDAPLLDIAHKSATTPVFNKHPLLAQDKFSTPPSGKAGTPPLPRGNTVLTERNRELGGRRPNALQVPPKNFLRHQERYMSPTDAMVSPISKGLLLRTKRPVRMTAPLAPLKALEAEFENENSLSNLNI